MAAIKILNSFKSIPRDDTGKASVLWSTNMRKFSAQAGIISDIKSDIQK